LKSMGAERRYAHNIKIGIAHKDWIFRAPSVIYKLSGINKIHIRFNRRIEFIRQCRQA
jgi:hypothetical protein